MFERCLPHPPEQQRFENTSPYSEIYHYEGSSLYSSAFPCQEQRGAWIASGCFLSPSLLRPFFSIASVALFPLRRWEVQSRHFSPPFHRRGGEVCCLTVLRVSHFQDAFALFIWIEKASLVAWVANGGLRSLTFVSGVSFHLKLSTGTDLMMICYWCTKLS